ncbi:MAG TPA: ATP-binding protein [Gemmatimonadales bacterium]|nr:ATP-binding protein [Gemmatimonadales bacterium]
MAQPSLPLLQGEPADLLRALTQISHAVSNAVSLEPIMQLAAEQAAVLLGADRSVLLLTDDAGGLRLRAWYGLERAEPASLPGPLNETLIAQLAPVLGEPSPETVLAVPLVVRGRVTGLIATVLDPRVESSAPAEVILTALADQMAAPLENARMAEEVRQAQLLLENARLQDAERVARQAADEGRDVLQALLEYIPEGITIADAPDARIRLVSRFGLDLLGRPWHEVHGLSAEQQASLVPMCRPDAAHPAPAEELPLVRAIRGGVVRGEEWLLCRPDNSRVPLLCDAGPIRDQAGTITGGIMAWREISAHKRMQQQLAQVQRLQAVGKLTGGVAHEVNNMMTVVIGFGRYVLQKLAPEHPRRNDVEQMVRAASRAAGMTKQLLAFSRQQVLRPSVISLEQLVEQLAPLLRQLVGADKRLELRLSPEPLHVLADPSQLEQVLINLVANARDAMGAEGQVTIETRERLLDQSSAAAHPEATMPPGRYAVVLVTDTGAGMDPSTQSRAFEPFYTTKPVGEGTGLGLAMVYGIIKQSGGYIWLDSELGRGTTVEVYFPLKSPGERAPPARDPHPARGGHETILVVEDEPMVRHFARRSLQALGYRVLDAESAREALAIVEQASPPVDLILSDVVMPGLGAKAMVEQVVRLQPTMQVLYMSGYPGDDVVRRGLLSPDAPFLQKPFTPEDLSRSIRSLLDRARESR